MIGSLLRCALVVLCSVALLFGFSSSCMAQASPGMKGKNKNNPKKFTVKSIFSGDTLIPKVTIIPLPGGRAAIATNGNGLSHNGIINDSDEFDEMKSQEGTVCDGEGEDCYEALWMDHSGDGEHSVGDTFELEGPDGTTITGVFTPFVG